MDINKKMILSVLIALAGSAAVAQESLVVYSHSSAQLYKTGLESVVKLSFEGDDIVIYTSEGQTGSFALTDVMSIKFDDLTSGIGNAETGKEGFTLYCRDGFIGADCWPDGAEAFAAVYDISGREVVSLGKWTGQPVSVANLSRGIYIFKVNDSTIKFTRQ